MKSRLFRPLVAALLLVSLTSTLAWASSKGKWENIGTSDNVKVSRMQVEGNSVFAFRGETVADVHIAKLVAVFVDPNERKHWVDRYDTHKTLERNERTEIYWIKFKLPFPVSNRDYVLHTEAKLDPDKRIFTANIKSIVDSRKPEDSCCVRAETFNTFYRFEAIPGEAKTRMMVEVHTDPKGLLPTWLVNRIQKDWPSKTLSNLIKHTQASKKTPRAELANWHD
jgi:hypothetical protein